MVREWSLCKLFLLISPLLNFSSIWQRKDESKLEQAAFMYPRLVKQAVGSREAAEMEPEEKAKFFAFIGALGIAGVPATLVCGIPAVAIRGARKVKHRFGRKD